MKSDKYRTDHDECSCHDMSNFFRRFPLLSHAFISLKNLVSSFIISLSPLKKNGQVARSSFLSVYSKNKRVHNHTSSFSFSFEPSHTSSSTTIDRNLSCCSYFLTNQSRGLFSFSSLSRLNDHSLSLSLSSCSRKKKGQTLRERKKEKKKEWEGEKSSLNKIRQSNIDKHYICFFSSSFSFIHIMTPRKSSYPLIAQAETLLIYGIFLLLTGLAQICVTLSHRYIIERTIHKNNNINLLNLLPVTLTLTDIHLWYIYPSAVLVSLNNDTKEKCSFKYIRACQNVKGDDS